MSTAPNEEELLRSIVPDLEAQGFEVYLHPGRGVVPPFLGSLRPDAIARGGEKNLVIEVVQSSRPSKKAERLAELMKGHPDWELRVIWVSPASVPTKLEIQSAKTIEASLQEVDQLSKQGHTGPALLLAWATFEALGRVLLPQDFARPQTPGRLVEMWLKKAISRRAKPMISGASQRSAIIWSTVNYKLT